MTGFSGKEERILFATYTGGGRGARGSILVLRISSGCQGMERTCHVKLWQGGPPGGHRTQVWTHSSVRLRDLLCGPPGEWMVRGEEPSTEGDGPPEPAGGRAWF